MKALAILHTALNTSLGLDCQTSAASARAGLVRSQEADNYPIGKPAMDEVESAIIHPLPFITSAFQDQARLGVILKKTLSDVCEQINKDGITIPIELYFSLPHPHRTNQGLALQTDEPSAQESELDDLLNTEDPDETLYNSTIYQSIKNLPWPVEPEIKKLFFSGSTGVSECIQAVIASTQNPEDNTRVKNQTYLTIVVAVDSLVSIKELKWLHGCSRLKNSDNPVGVQPGEAGAAFTVCTSKVAIQLGLKPQAHIQTCIIDNNSTSQLKAQNSDGKVLANILDRLLPVTDKDNILQAWVMSDHNGEESRAAEWGGALHFLTKYKPHVVVGDTWMPAISFGHTDAAYGAIAISLICEAFNRDYAPSSQVYVMASADSFLRSGITVTLANVGQNNV
jgi:3-oxoacyl-[acyl-carrier-protein] synthase-1